jgi:glycosyltransferase involved in cell wall biosynthesis
MERPRINILFPISHLGIGGAEQQLLELVRGIDKERFKPIVVTLFPGGSLDNEFKSIPEACLLSVDRKGKYDFWTIYKLVKLLRRERVDVIQPFLIPATFLGLVSALINRTPVKILTERGSSRPRERLGFRLYQKAQDKLTPFTDWVVANSQAGQSYLMSRGIDPVRIKVIYNGISMNRLVPDPVKVKSIRDQFELPSGGIVIGMTANFHDDKDHTTFIRGAKIIHDAMPQTRFALLGEGDRRTHIESLVKDLGLGSVVTFFGHQREIASYVACYDIACLCSTYSEGCSNVILESMALGKPVVASDLAGNRELVEHEKKGLLARVRDPEAFADAVLTYLRRPDWAQEVAESGRKMVATKFSLERMIRDYETLYEQTLLQKARKKPGAS